MTMCAIMIFLGVGAIQAQSAEETMQTLVEEQIESVLAIPTTDHTVEDWGRSAMMASLFAEDAEVLQIIEFDSGKKIYLTEGSGVFVYISVYTARQKNKMIEISSIELEDGGLIKTLIYRLY